MRQLGQLGVVAAGGVCFFAAADYLTRRALHTAGCSFPSSVAVIIGLGTTSLHPRLGGSLQRWLGPGGAILRAGLPLFLAPVILMPLVVQGGDLAAESLPAVVALASFATLFTLGSCGAWCWAGPACLLRHL